VLLHLFKENCFVWKLLVIVLEGTRKYSIREIIVPADAKNDNSKVILQLLWYNMWIIKRPKSLLVASR